MAFAERIDRGQASNKFFYVLMGDGELDAGNVWEAAMLAGKEKLHNIIAIVDRNNIQIDGYTEDIMPLEPLYEKWESFNWQVREIDGHNFNSINDAILQSQSDFGRPSIIIAHTIPGKGVKEFERDYTWHGKPRIRREADMALKELRTLGGKIRGEHE